MGGQQVFCPNWGIDNGKSVVQAARQAVLQAKDIAAMASKTDRVRPAFVSMEGLLRCRCSLHAAHRSLTARPRLGTEHRVALVFYRLEQVVGDAADIAHSLPVFQQFVKDLRYHLLCQHRLLNKPQCKLEKTGIEMIENFVE